MLARTTCVLSTHGARTIDPSRLPRTAAATTTTTTRALHLTIRQALQRHRSPSSASSVPDPSLSLGLGAEEITISGWVRSVRRQKRRAFVEITDGSITAPFQSVVTLDGGDAQDWTGSLTSGSSVSLTGFLRNSPGRGQDTELQVTRIKLLGGSDPSRYPIQKKRLSPEFLRSQAHLRPRTTTGGAVLRVRDALMRGVHDYFEQHDFVHVHTPILTSNDCEGAGEMFQVLPPQDPTPSLSAPHPSPSSSSTPDGSPLPPLHPPADTFFTPQARLTVSSQLHLEAVSASLGRAYTLSPCFRAEPSQTNRHLAEFYMLEAEMSFVGLERERISGLHGGDGEDGDGGGVRRLEGREDGLEEVMDVVEGFLKHAVGSLIEVEGTTAAAGRTARSARALEDLRHLFAAAEDSKSEAEIARQERQREQRGDLGAASTSPPVVSSSAPPLTLLDSLYAHFTPTTPRWPRLTYTQVLTLLHAHHAHTPFITAPPTWGKGLAAEHEKWLAGEHVGGPVFVTDYPRAIKPFYMRVNDARSNAAQEEAVTVACFDLLVPRLGELVGGSLREERLDVLLSSPHLPEAIKKARDDGGSQSPSPTRSAPTPSLDWYLDLRRYGTVPHGGFGVGWERLVAFVTGVDNVREATAFPRAVGGLRY